MADKMKTAFISGAYRSVENLNEFLKSNNVTTKLGWFIGYRTIEVPCAQYNKAITIGGVYIGENDKNGYICCVSPDGTRMHNADNLAITAHNALKNKKYIDNKSIEELTQSIYSTFNLHEEYEEEFSK